MKLAQKFFATRQYGMWGIAFGFIFPIISMCIDLIHQDLVFSWDSIVIIYSGQPLQWIIATAPFFLGILAAFAGYKQDQLSQLNANLEVIVEKRTEELEQTNRELKEFSYIVSHDLKAPLRGIGTLAMFIKEDLGEVMDEMTEENVDLMIGRVKRMESLINGILEYSRVGRKHTKEEAIDLQEEIPMYLDSLNYKENVTVNFPLDMPTIHGNKIRVQQIFQNIISNAIKYNDKEFCQVDISFEEQDTHHVFRIKDNGPGIDPKYQSKVFGIFQTLQSKDSSESTGIGLSIVKKIIADHGGKIWIESEVGKGATFAFTWKKVT